MVWLVSTVDSQTRLAKIPEIMETFMMVKPEEFRALVDYYKGKIAESSLLDKAARVATEAHLLVEDETIPAALKEPVVKQLMMNERDLADKL